MGVLRLFLALSVINSHTGGLGFLFLDGRLAVQAFYLVSGFYMALVLHERYTTGASSYFQFISNRFLRIFPAYYLVLLATVLLSIWASYVYGDTSSPLALWKQNWLKMDWQAKVFLLFSHLSLLGQDAYLFFGLGADGTLNFDPNFRASHNDFWNFMFIPQAWSLSLELYFYLLAPLLVRRSASMLAVMIIGCLVVRYVLASQFGWLDDPWAYRFFPSELALFLCGAGAYRVYRAVRLGNMNTQTWVGWAALGIAVGIVMSISYNFSWKMLLSGSPYEHRLFWNAGFVVLVSLALPFLFKYTQRIKIDRHLGELSYPMYLSHIWVIWLFYFLPISPGWARLTGIYSVTVLVSVMLYWWVDRKVDTYRHRKFFALKN